MAKTLPPDIAEWLESAKPENDSPDDEFYHAQAYKATMITRSLDPAVDQAWSNIRGALRPGHTLLEFFLALPERPSIDPHQSAFGRSSPLDVKRARTRQKQYMEAAEVLYELVEDGRRFGGYLLAAQIDENARDHVISVSVALPAMQKALPHLIELLKKVDPADQIPSGQPSAQDADRKNYCAQVADTCGRYLESTPFAAVAVVTNAIAGSREDDEDWITAEGLRKQVDRRRTN